MGVARDETASTQRTGLGPVMYQYKYITGDTNTNITAGWRSENSPDGSKIYNVIDELTAANMYPVFTYYQIFDFGSNPGNDAFDLTTLNDATSMGFYLADMKFFFQKVGSRPTVPVIVHFEPDLFGYVQQNATGDDAGTVPAKINNSSPALPELADLPNTAAGLAQAVVRLRDLYAPNAILGYHWSPWGTGTDLLSMTTGNVASLVTRSCNFYLSLGASFDVLFGGVSDRCAGFNGQYWTSTNFDVHVAAWQQLVQTLRRRFILWQVAYGNRVMRSCNNTTGHYQSFESETWLGDPTFATLKRYRDIGMLAMLWGAGATSQTYYTDNQGDGITNPTAITVTINGVQYTNSTVATNSDDDGGYFRSKVAAYMASPLLIKPMV